MATIVFISILAVACVFMVYVLVEFHLEAKRPRHPGPPLPKGVISFRRGSAGSGEHLRQYAKNAGDSPQPRAGKSGSEMTAAVLRVGIGRLAAKRIGRS